MRRRWLLSLLCLSVFFLSLVQLTRARGEFKVSESNTRILFEKRQAEVMLAVENSTGETLNTSIELEILDPENQVTAKTGQNRSITAGNQKLSLPLPLFFSNLDYEDRKELLWYRLRYRINEGVPAGNTIASGIISFSEITSDLFDLQVATSDVVRENNRLLARVQASHPLTRKPAANVQIDGELIFDVDDEKKKTLRSLKTTDSNGQALLEFVIPPLFPQLRYNVGPDDAELRVSGKRGGIVATVNGEVKIDQFAHTLVSSDKPLYQPGQVMHIRALLFTPAKRALANQNATIRISDPDGTTVYRTVAKTSRFGVATTDWTIPENIGLGEYVISVGVDGGEEVYEAGIAVRISRYDLPNFTVNVDTDRDYYLPGQNAEVRVRADYLFGKPVTRGQVRVVRETHRYWNYRDQKWEVDEGETYEGETDAKGVFVAQMKLASGHESLSDDYEHFNDLTYAAYFTDPTTNRTEQRRFDLRVTREPIHVYVMYNGEWVENNSLPLKFYVSTSYADGTPAQVNVNVSIKDESSGIAKPSLATVRTNRYGLAKVSGMRLPSELADDSEVKLVVSAVDSKGLRGSRTERISFDDDDEQAVRVETDKALYRSGEPITAFVTSSVPDQNVVVDLFRESNLIRSERVKLYGGRGKVVFAYRPEFKDKLTLAAYGRTAKWRNSIGSHTILYPRDPELKVDVRTTQASYRPGEDAQVNLSVRAPEGRIAESALGVVVLDKAVEERFRTTKEFGSRVTTVNDSFAQFLGVDQNVAGMSIRDLQRLNMSKRIPADMELVAELLLSQTNRQFRTFHGDDQYNRDQTAIFDNSIKQQLMPVREALESRYARTLEYPTDEQSLRRLLSDSKIDFNSLRDPWDIPYRTWYSVVQHSDQVVFESAGADKRFDTADDFVAYRLGWPYFRPTGEAINKAVSKYYDRTGKFVRDSSALREALAADGLNMDQLIDEWGKPYRFEFDVNGINYLIKIKSGGADKQFSDDKNYSADDFVIWISSHDYFEKNRERIGEALRQNSENTNSFPETEKDLRAVLRNSPGSLDTLRDPWDRSYYITFKTESFPMDRLQVEDRSSFSQPATPQTSITPVVQTARFISLRSAGADGRPETSDDFSVAVFTGLLSEWRKGEPRPAAPGVVFLRNSGAIHGVVTDPNGAVIPGTTVMATLAVERLTYRLRTNDDGKFRLINLPPGIYEVHFEAPGFTKHIVTHVLVSASHATELNVSLRPGAVVEAVTVSGDAGGFLALTAGTVSTNVRKSDTITKSGTTQQLSTPRLREYFPETLLWQPSIETDKQGRAKINFKLADNITTWKMVVIGSTEDGQIGMTEKEIKAFQPFFIDHDPPRVLTEGDEISLPVTVRNYLEREQKVDLEIKPENWFSLIGPARKQINVAPSDATSETFDLRAIATIKNGKQRITATGNDDSDAIEKPVTVHPDGEELSVTDGDIITDRSALELDIPETMIPTSKRAQLKIYPNLMTHVVESVEGIMERPYGCGEQTISSTYPSLLLSRFYKQSGGDFPLRGRAERYLNNGYDRLLGYRHKNGGFTYWGTGEPDFALTAYALRFLTSASEVISVDPDVIKQAREWLVSQQQPNGSWGSVQNTAYVARIIAQSSPEQSEALKRAVAYLNTNVAASNDPYLLASYALAVIDSGDVALAKPGIDKLRLLSHVKGTALYWTAETTPFYGWGRAGQVETTALVVQALSRYCETQSTDCEANKKLINLGLLFLLQEKDRYGVWHSTQATINSLDAMLMSLAKSSTVGAGLSETHVVMNGRVVQSVQIPVGDRLNNPTTVDITQFVNAGKNRIEFRRAAGSPLASVQAVASFYVPWSDSSAKNNGKNGLRLNVKFDKTEGRINDEITCNVEAERAGFGGGGMLLAEIGLPPGAEVDRNSLQAALKNSDGAINSYDVLPDRVVVYLWPRTGGIKFNFKFRPRLGMNARTAPSTVYDYYNPDARAVVAPATFKVR